MCFNFSWGAGKEAFQSTRLHAGNTCILPSAHFRAMLFFWLLWTPNVPLLRDICQIFLCISNSNVGSKGLVLGLLFFSLTCPLPQQSHPCPSPSPSLLTQVATHLFSIQIFLQSPGLSVQLPVDRAPQMSHRHLQVSVSLTDLHPVLHLFFLQGPVSVDAHPSA